MRHLVTGGSGFIGSLLAERLLARGEQVRVIDVWPDPARSAGIDFVQGSVLDEALVASAMQGIDVVHHTAALVAQTASGRDFATVNAQGSRIVAEAAVRARARAVVHVSSTAVYGLPPDGLITDRTPLRPFEDYGRSKLEGERLIHATCAAAGVPLITIRPRATLGAGRLGIFALLFDWIARGRPVFVIGRGDRPMQFIHADDLIGFHLHALDGGRWGTYNVGTDRYGTLRGDLEGLIRDAASRSRVIGLPKAPAIGALAALHRLGLSPLVPWHYRTYHRACAFDVAPLLATGWRPGYSNADMLRESYGWFRRRHGATPGGSPHRSPIRRGVLGLVR